MEFDEVSEVMHSEDVASEDADREAREISRSTAEVPSITSQRVAKAFSRER